MQRAGTGSTSIVQRPPAAQNKSRRRKGRGHGLKSRFLSADSVTQSGTLSSLRAEADASVDLHRVVRCPTAGPPEEEIIRSSEPAQVNPSPDNSNSNTTCPSFAYDTGMIATINRSGFSVLSIGAERLPSVVVIGCRSLRVSTCSRRLSHGVAPFWK